MHNAVDCMASNFLLYLDYLDFKFYFLIVYNPREVRSPPRYVTCPFNLINEEIYSTLLKKIKSTQNYVILLRISMVK